jgi:hypothetical protein
MRLALKETGRGSRFSSLSYSYVSRGDFPMGAAYTYIRTLENFMIDKQ